MGWTTTNKPKGMPVLDFFIERGVLRWSNPDVRYTVLDSALVKMKTFYAAVERVELATGERRVWAAVILVDYGPWKHDPYNFGWKDMDESCGPCESECPERILKLLTSTESQYANEWRARCWKRIEDQKAKPKLCVGAEIVLYRKRYKVEANLGRMGWSIRLLDGGGIYRLTVAKARDCTEVIVEASAAMPTQVERLAAPSAEPGSARPRQVEMFA